MKSRLPVLGAFAQAAAGRASDEPPGLSGARIRPAVALICVASTAPQLALRFAGRLAEGALAEGCVTALALHEPAFAASALHRVAAAQQVTETDTNRAQRLLAALEAGQLAVGLGWSWLLYFEPTLHIEVDAPRGWIAASVPRPSALSRVLPDLRAPADGDALAARLGRWLGRVRPEPGDGGQARATRELTPGRPAADS